jgi:hypothetical protein
MEYDRKSLLKIERLLNGCYNYFNNPLSKASSLRNTLNEIYEYKINLKNDLCSLYNLGLQKNRPDLILALLRISTKNDFNEELCFEDKIDRLFNYICYNRASLLKRLLDSELAKEICPYKILDVLTKKVSTGLLDSDPNMLVPYVREKYYKNINLKRTKAILLQDIICANTIISLDKDGKLNYNKFKFYYKNNPELKRRTKARWTLIFFFAKYIRKSGVEWAWMPGGPMFKRAKKNWDEKI